jgi:hypothetical protein
MSTSQSIQGLIKWSQRGEWRDNFETALERHVGPPCRSAGIGLDELAEIIGDHWMTTLWGCVFADLVLAGRAERNVADDYLKRRGWKESAGTRAYIEALRRSSMSLYEVIDIVGGVRPKRCPSARLDASTSLRRAQLPMAATARPKWSGGRWTSEGSSRTRNGSTRPGRNLLPQRLRIR